MVFNFGITFLYATPLFQLVTKFLFFFVMVPNELEFMDMTFAKPHPRLPDILMLYDNVGAHVFWFFGPWVGASCWSLAKVSPCIHFWDYSGPKSQEKL
jgi:hypothetical protein